MLNWLKGGICTKSFINKHSTKNASPKAAHTKDYIKYLYNIRFRPLEVPNCDQLLNKVAESLSPLRRALQRNTSPASLLPHRVLLRWVTGLFW